MDMAATEIYTLSLHDALPIFGGARVERVHAVLGDVDVEGAQIDGQQRIQGLGDGGEVVLVVGAQHPARRFGIARSEEHTSELQSLAYLVCRLLLEKKNIMILI